MINWNKYADKYYVISWTKNFDKRKRLEKQFIDIGLENYEYKYSVNVKYLINPPEFMIDIHLYCTFTHYITIKEAYELGYESIIIMEDDLSFLKDIDEIKKQLDTYYNTGDIVLFDYISLSKLNSKVYFFTSCYRLNRNGMKYMIDNIEDHLYIIDNYFINCGENESISIDHVIFNTNNGEILKTIELPYINVSGVIPKIQISEKRICIQTKYIDEQYLPHDEYYNYKNDINLDEYSL